MRLNDNSMMTIQHLRHRYMTKELTPEQVIEQIIQKVSDDHAMGIWITPPSWEMISPYLVQLNHWSIEEKPLWGIPFAIKDNIELAGVPLTAGCPDFAYIPKQHATVVKLLIEAGAIPIGKTNLDQFATGLVGTRSPYGATQNAINKDWISGGSSSGSAVAVARGHCGFAIGTDTAGSGRIPAALNRIVGFKPSLGSWSKRGVIPACESIDCVSLFTHSVDEAIYVDRVLRTADSEDSWSYSRKPITPQLPSKWLVPWESLQFFGQLADDYKKAWGNSLHRMRNLGVTVVPVDGSLFSRASSLLYEGPWIAERWVALGAFIEKHTESVLSVTEKVLRSGSPSHYDANDVFRSMHELQRLRLEVRKLLQDAIVVFPTSGGTWTRQEVANDPLITNQAMGLYTNHCNLLGLTALALPSMDAAEGMPFGITLFALEDQESLLMGAGEQWEISQSEKLPDSLNLSSISKETSEAYVLLAVCGLHMRGLALEEQMHEHGATFLQATKTAANYQLIKLPTTPPKPGLIKTQERGVSIEVEIWQMPLSSFGTFAASIPAPLGIGKVELIDGTLVSGFLCEGYAAANAEDLSKYGGWREAEKSF
jgi:allophanate hydrolase